MGFSTKSSLFYLSVVLSAILLVHVHALMQSSTVKKFQTGPFTFSPAAGIYNLTGLGFDGISAGMSLLAFGDFNSDKYTDVVGVTDNLNTVSIFLWDHDNCTNSPPSANNDILIDTFQNTQNITFTNDVTSAIPADLDYDGLVDLLIITLGDTSTTYNYYAYLSTRNSTTPFDVNNYAISFSYPPQQPTVAYLDDSFKVSFIVNDNDGNRLAFNFTNVTNSNPRKLDLNPNYFYNYVSNATGCLPYTQVSAAQIQNPNFNSFVDLNGDCKADLFIMSSQSGGNYFEFWVRSNQTGGGTFCLVENSQVTTQVGSLGFADIDGDSGIDLVYIESGTNPNIHIIFNQFKNVPNKGCTGTNVTTSALPYLNTTNSNRTKIYDATANNSATLVYKLSNTGGIPTTAQLFSFNATNRPHQLRFGDINMDGNPDLLVTVVLSNNTQKTWVLYNNLAGSSESVRDLGTMKPSDMDNDVNQIIADTGSNYATFFDFDEIGTQSLFFVTTGNGYSKIEGYYNNLNQASFFLKALGLNGAQANQSDFYAGMYFGSTFECEVTDINGTNIHRKGIQLSKGSYAALQLPYAFLGLGKTNNYIENFVYGYPLTGPNTHQWSPIIPNSQLIITPTGLDPSNWKIDVFVKPTSNTIIVVVTTAAILLVLGMVICYLHYKEKEEDKQHQEKYLHLLG